MDMLINKKPSRRLSGVREFLGFLGFVIIVLVGTVLINTFVFRSFLVSGHSMDHTLANGDRLIVNRLPVTIDQIKNETYMPKRGQIIVFKNPLFVNGAPDEYIVKRVIAFPGERVTVSNGVMTVYNTANPAGFHPDPLYQKNGVGPQEPTSGNVDTTVPDGTVFVSGDNRIGDNSFDSRSGLGTIPTFDIVGPVSLRIFPINHFTVF